MKLRNAFLVILLISFSVGFSLGATYLISSGKAGFTNQIEDYLTSTIDVNGERIDDFVNEIKGDTLFLARSEKTSSVLKKNLVKSEEAAVIDVEGKVDIIAIEIENYLLAHPDMGLKDLQASNEFQDIAVRDVAQSGYSVILDAEDMEIYFHIDSKFIGMKRGDILKNSEDAVNIFDDAIESDAASGFYDWTDLDGERRKKYLEARKLTVKTADGVDLALLTTSYVDDYLVAKNVSEKLDSYFEEFILKKDYSNILFLSSEGVVSYMVRPTEGLGTSTEKMWEEITGSSFSDEEVPLGDVLFYGPFKASGDGGLYVLARSNVYVGNENVGTIVLVKDIKHIIDILGNENIGNENYLIDRNFMLITPLKSRSVDLLTQEIKTESAQECLDDFDAAKKLGISVSEYNKLELMSGKKEEFRQFLDFKGDLIFGLERPIGFVNWCLLSEIDVEDVLVEPMKRGVMMQVIFRGFMFFLLFILIIIVSSFIGDKYTLEWKSKPEIERNFFNRAFDVVGGNWVKKIGRIRCILMGIIFSVMYFIIMTMLFESWKPSFMMIFPYSVILAISIAIFSHGSSIGNSTRKFLFWGAMCLALSSSTQIPLILYSNSISSVSNFYWSFPILLNATGFLFLLIFFRRQYD